MKENERRFTVLYFYCMTEVPRIDERLENVGLFSVFDGNIYSEISLDCQRNDTENVNFFFIRIKIDIYLILSRILHHFIFLQYFC